MSVSWLLAFTKPRAESLAEEHLRRQGYESLVPLFLAQKRRRDRWQWLEEPLFPRYVFVGVAEGQSWAPIRSTVGVAALVRFGGHIATVPDALVEELRRTGEAGPHRHRPVFRQGESVRILGDGFSGIEGVFQMTDGEQRAAVLISLLGRPVTVRVDLAELVPS